MRRLAGDWVAVEPWADPSTKSHYAVSRGQPGRTLPRSLEQAGRPSAAFQPRQSHVTFVCSTLSDFLLALACLLPALNSSYSYWSKLSPHTLSEELGAPRHILDSFCLWLLSNKDTMFLTLFYCLWVKDKSMGMWESMS